MLRCIDNLLALRLYLADNLFFPFQTENVPNGVPWHRHEGRGEVVIRSGIHFDVAVFMTVRFLALCGLDCFSSDNTVSYVLRVC